MLLISVLVSIQITLEGYPLVVTSILIFYLILFILGLIFPEKRVKIAGELIKKIKPTIPMTHLYKIYINKKEKESEG